jgi:hypothetical protein
VQKNEDLYDPRKNRIKHGIINNNQVLFSGVGVALGENTQNKKK